MKPIERMKNYFISDSYFVSIYEGHIYIMNYDKILSFTDQKCIIQFESFNICLKGESFRLVRKTKRELDINGNLNNMEIIYEKN